MGLKQSLTYYRNGASLFFEVIHPMSRSHRLKNRGLNPISVKVTSQVAPIKCLRFAILIYPRPTVSYEAKLMSRSSVQDNWHWRVNDQGLKWRAICTRHAVCNNAIAWRAFDANIVILTLGDDRFIHVHHIGYGTPLFWLKVLWYIARSLQPFWMTSLHQEAYLKSLKPKERLYICSFRVSAVSASSKAPLTRGHMQAKWRPCSDPAHTGYFTPFLTKLPRILDIGQCIFGYFMSPIRHSRCAGRHCRHSHWGDLSTASFNRLRQE